MNHNPLFVSKLLLPDLASFKCLFDAHAPLPVISSFVSSPACYPNSLAVREHRQLTPSEIPSRIGRQNHALPCHYVRHPDETDGFIRKPSSWRVGMKRREV